MFKQVREGDDVDTVIIRPSATTLFAISSSDRYKSWAQRRTNPTSPFSFIIQKNQALMNGYFRRLAMTEFRMNWTLPNIALAWGNDRVNFSYILSGTTYTFQIIISDGFYGSEELAQSLQDCIRAGGYASDSQTFVAGIPKFVVSVYVGDEDSFNFLAPVGYTFWFTAIGSNYKELFDMLVLPAVSTPGVNAMVTGVPDLRATEYIDLVCSQLTNNMRQKDSTSAPVVRDMLARIYTDDDVPSQAVFNTNYYNTTIGTATTSNYTFLDNNTVNFLTTSSNLPSVFAVNEVVNISGITGGSNWNSEAIVRNTPTNSNIVVYYTSITPPTGTPVLSNGLITGTQGSLTQTSAPQTTWDDKVNGVTPFVLYRQFPVPKQIAWEHTQPIGNLQFEMYDSQGRSMADLWNPFGNGQIIQPISGYSISGNVVTYTVLSTNGFNPGQYALISGVTIASGYNGFVTIQSIASSTSVLVRYPASVTLSGTPTLTIANITLGFNFTDSFSWNASILCSED